MPKFDEFPIPEFRLQSGVTLPEARLAFKTYGTLNPDRSNAILYPTSFGAQHPDIEWLGRSGAGFLGFDKILRRHSKHVRQRACRRPPSNLAGSFDGSRFPSFTPYRQY